MRQLQQLKRLLFAAGGLPIVWIGLTIVALVPIWHQRLLPQLDTPNHLALIRAWHSFHDASYKIADHYALRVRPVPYFLFYLTVHLLMYVVNIEVANKLFLSAYIVLYPLAILSLALALKRTPWLALGGFLLLFNQNWIYGFSSFLMGTAFMFFSLAALFRLLDDGRARHAWALAVLSILCYFSHVEDWFCFGVAAISILLLYRRQWRRGLIASAAMLPSVMFAVIAYFEERHDRSYFHNGDGLTALNGSWRDFPTAVMEFPRRVMELFPGNLDRNILIILALTVLGLCIWRGTTFADDDAPRAKRLWTLLVVWLVVYVSLPYQIFRPMAWWYVSPRVPAMMAPLLLLLPALPPSLFTGRSWQRLLFLPIVVCAVVLPLKLARLYGSFSQRNVPFMHLVAQLPRGAKVMVVVRNMMRGPGSEELSGDPSTSAPVYWHFSSWPMALNGGYSPYLFDQGIPVVPKLKLKAPPWANTDTFDIRQAPDFDYYLVRDPADEMEREPSLKLQERVGNWVLFKRIYKSTDEP